jgi:DNA repair protein RadC
VQGKQENKMNLSAKSQDPAEYRVKKAAKRSEDDEIISQAIAILQRRLGKEREAFHTPGAVKQFCALRAAAREDQNREVFAVLFLDSQNKLIEVEDMFVGTLSQTSVYPREVVRAAMRHNAQSVVFTHNHPSGSVQPSRADEHLTHTLKASLALVDVRLLDHIITGCGGQTLSMAEQGLV